MGWAFLRSLTITRKRFGSFFFAFSFYGLSRVNLAGIAGDLGGYSKRLLRREYQERKERKLADAKASSVGRAGMQRLVISKWQFLS